jgi:hypothetical protein
MYTAGMAPPIRLPRLRDHHVRVWLAAATLFGLVPAIAAVLWIDRGLEANPSDGFLVVLGICAAAAAACLGLAWGRHRTLRRLERSGVCLRATILGFRPHPTGWRPGSLTIAYQYEGQEHRQRLPRSTAAGTALARRGWLDVVIDPGDPETFGVTGGYPGDGRPADGAVRAAGAGEERPTVG